MSKPSEQPFVDPSEPRRSSAKELVDQLPRSTWHERSYAYWAERQLHANDTWWRPLSSAVVGVSNAAMGMFLALGFRKVVAEDLHKLTD
ncbi:hypothetical protein GGI04_005902, partial [Coemansia thaxteri]